MEQANKSKDAAANENEQQKKEFKEITVKFGKGLMGEPFQGKDGNEYVSIKIPNKDRADSSPWASFVVRAKAVHENQFGKGMWVKLPSEGSTTVTKPVLVGRNEEGKNQWKDEKTKVPNKELKGMVEFYKEKTSLKEKMEQNKGQVAESKKTQALENSQDRTAAKPKTKGNEL